MSILFLLLPLSMLIAAVFLVAFIWAVRTGQYEDTCTPSLRLLTEEKLIKVPLTLTSPGEREQLPQTNGTRENSFSPPPSRRHGAAKAEGRRNKHSAQHTKA